MNGPIRPQGITARTYIQPISKTKRIPKRLRLMDRIELNTDELEAFTTVGASGKCAIGWCGKEATTVKAGCKYSDPRCKEHENYLCRGATGTMECRCAINAEWVAVRGKHRGNPAGTKRKKKLTMKEKKRRCMEIEIGDKITIIDADEGEVEACLLYTSPSPRD